MFRLINDILDDILWPAVFVMGFWIVFLFNHTYKLGLNEYGVHPHEWTGMIGIVTSPFLHGGLRHIFSNSIPFLVSGAFIFHFFPKKSWHIMGLMWFFSGFGTWLIANEGTNHIGASGVLYGMVAFLLTSGIIRKNRSLMATALILVFLYGSMVWGLFPQVDPYTMVPISWQGHLSGTITGVILAFQYRNSGPEDDTFFDEEDEWDDEEDDDPFWSRDYFEQEDFKINYRYKRREPDQDD